MYTTMNLAWITFILCIARPLTASGDQSSSLLNRSCTKNEHACLYLYKVNEEGFTWEEANQACQGHNSHLTAINNQKIRNIIRQILTVNVSNDQGAIKAWIGGKESVVDDNWQWLDGTSYAGSLTTNPSADTYRSCATINRTTTASQIFPETCHLYRENYICSFESKRNGDCPNKLKARYVNITTTRRRCHAVYNAHLTWYEAYNKCMDKSGILASFNLTDNDRATHAHFEQLGTIRAWIGLRRWRWKWTTLRSSPTFNYTSWNPGAPSAYNENCAFLYLDGGEEADTGKWGDEACSEQLPYFICQNDTERYRRNRIEPTTAGKSTAATTSNPVSRSSTVSEGLFIDLTKEDINIIIAVVAAVVVLIIVLVISIVLIRKRRRTRQKSPPGDQRATSAQRNGVTDEHAPGNVYSTSLPDAAAYANPNHINSRVDGVTDAAGYSEVVNDQSSRESGINHYAEVTNHSSPPRGKGPELGQADTATPRLPTTSVQDGSLVSSAVSLNGVDHKMAPGSQDLYTLPRKGH